MADILAVNKADGDRIVLAQQACIHYATATHLLPPKPNGWTPKVLTCSAQAGTGIAELWQTIQDYQQTTLKSGFFIENRRQQAHYWLHEALQAGLRERFFQNPTVRERLAC